MDPSIVASQKRHDMMSAFLSGRISLVPTASYSNALETALAGGRDVLRDLDVPTIDLLDAFDEIPDVSSFMGECGIRSRKNRGY